MKRTLLLMGLAISSVFGFAQINNVSVYDVQHVSLTDLTNCNDTSAYLNDTVRVLGIVMHDGNLTEISSSSTADGYRAAIHLMDTATAGMGGDFKGIQIHGVFNDGSGNQPVSALNTLFAGDSVEITGVVGRYQGETQIYPLDNQSVIVKGLGTAPMPRVVDLGDLNDNNKVNQLTTGEALEGSLVMLNNVTVTSVNFFSGGSRVSIDVTDVNGNTINVSDRFLVQKLSSYTTVNPSSPLTTGAFVAPPVGLVYDTLIGIILHSENGCTGGTGRGYEINPFDASHYVQGPSPADITKVTRTPSVPTSTESPVVGCNVIDFAPGSVSQVTLFYTDDIAGGVFDSVNFTAVGGTDDYTANIPAFADAKMIGYYIKATDNDGLVSQYPATPAGAATNNLKIYTVRDNGLTIVDVQKVLDYNNDASYYMGDTVTVTGVVSSSTKDFDLGYVYIQQPGASAWSGLSLIGHSDLVLLLRTEEVTVTGVIEEYYGFTRMRVTDVNKTGNIIANEVTYFDPSDDNLYTSGQMEEFESMLVGMENSATGLYMMDAQIQFNGNATSEYIIGSSATATRGTYVTAGRQSNSAFSSLWVSLVSSGYFWANNGQMEVDTVITTNSMQMDTVAGIMYYGFGNYEVMPRNNDDIVGLSDNGTAIVLDTTNLSLPTSVVEINGASVETVVYPNPATSDITIAVSGLNDTYKVAIYDLAGRVVSASVNGNVSTTISVANLQNGVYLIKVTNVEGTQLAIDKIVVKH
tara:strand:- start:11927 stop:14173 length:2247 start_codon:yes stop_codon:yes gene_type:complete